MVLPLKCCKHYCASCRICSSVVLVTVFLSRQTGLNIKIYFKKSLCAVSTGILQVMKENSKSGQSCNVNCSYFDVAYSVCNCFFLNGKLVSNPTVVLAFAPLYRSQIKFVSRTVHCELLRNLISSSYFYTFLKEYEGCREQELNNSTL